MRRYYSILSIAALSLAAIVSCNKEIENPTAEQGEKIEITVMANDEVDNAGETKTYAFEQTGDDSKTYTHIYWSVGTDKIQLYESVDGEYQNRAESTAATSEDGGATASFAVTLTGEAVGSSYSYIAAYPSTCIDKSNDFYRVCIPASQTLRGTGNNNLAANADVLISNPVVRDTRISSGESLSYNFKRFGTTVKMTLKGITSTEKISKVELTAPTGIVGYTKINLATGELEENPYYTTKKVTLTVPDLVATGTDAVWFRVLSGTWNASVSYPIEVIVTTDKATYSKTITSTSKSLEFAEGGLTTFGISGMTRKEHPTVPDGEYIIVGPFTSGGSTTYHALSCVASTTRLTDEDITDGFNAASYTGSNYDLVWNINTTNDGITITTLDGAYLKAASSGASTSDDAQYFKITKSDDRYKIFNNSFELQYNTSSKWWAFYASTTSMVKELLLVPASVDKSPVIALDKASVSLPSNTESYTITFKKRFLTGDVSAKIGSDVDGIVSNLEASNSNVVVTLNPNSDPASKTATILVCSESDGIEESFTLALQPYRATKRDVLTAALFPATGSGYTPFSNKKKPGSGEADNGITSDAVYAGSTAKNGSNIQLNTSYGIWTTASGGIVSTVSVSYGNANSKNINVYGKNSAFSSNSTDGATLIGTLNASTLSVTATSDYEYILFKSSGATYPASLSITWKAKATATGISVKTAPAKTEYHVGDAFDPTGLVINVTYDDGSDEDVTYGEDNASQFTFTPALDVVGGLQPSNTAVTITYKGQSANQSINVYTWIFDSLVKDSNPTKTTYWEGEVFNAAGMTAHAHYVDNKPTTPNTRDDVASADGLNYSTDPLTTGTASIVVSKTIGEVTKSFTQAITVNARPTFTVTPSNNSANPIAIGEGAYDAEPISVTAGAGVVWTVSKVSGAGDIVFTENGTGTGNINVMIGANSGAARDFVLRVSSSTEGVSTASYDVYLHQDAASVITTVDLATPTGLAYSNSTKKLTWNAVTTDVNGTALVGYTPKYNLTIDGNTVATNLTETQYDITTLSPKLAAGGHTATLVAVGDGSVYTNSTSANLAAADFNVSYGHEHNLGAAVYTLSFAKLTSGSNYNSYTASHDITVDNKQWTVYGNQSLGAWLQVGGKTSTSTDRTLTSKVAVSNKKIGKVSIEHDGIGNGKNCVITVNSIKVEGCTSSNFPTASTKSKTITSPDVSSSGTLDFELDPSDDWDANSYFRITVNYQVRTTSGSTYNNCYLKVNSIKFYPCN